MALFMAYGILTTALLLVGCHLGEKSLMTFGRASRAIWLLGLAVAVCLLAAGIVGTPGSPAPSSYQSGELVIAANATPVTVASPSTRAPTLLESLSTGLKAFDGALLWLWLTGTVLAIFGLVILTIRARRLIANADSTMVEGVPVLLSDGVGPALMGIFKYDIVVPRWTLGLSREHQSLVVAHEQQHARVFDPLLVWIAAFAIVLFPWNVSLWYLIRRLRTSIEMDCDRRVLASSFNAHAYASLLVDVGARVSSRPFFAAALSESASQLQRRIRAMSSIGQPFARMRTVASAIAAFCLLGAAFRAPRPEVPVYRPGADANPGHLAGKTGVTPGARRNIATVSIESQSGASVALMVFTTKSARIVVSGLSVRLTSDTLRLRTPATLTADLTDGEVHLASVDGSVLDVTALFRDSPAADAKAQMPHVILDRGGTGIESGNAMPQLRASAGQRPQPGPEIEPYLESQVETRATQIAGTGVPRYPDALRAAGVQGEVQAQFVVNEYGNVELSTFKVLRSGSSSPKQARHDLSVPSDDMFVKAVRTALPTMRFSPALVGGKPVRQLVQQPFKFVVDHRL